MAIFEKKIVEKVTLDDTETISCVIENSQTINGHTVSIHLHVSNKLSYIINYQLSNRNCLISIGIRFKSTKRADS